MHTPKLIFTVYFVEKQVGCTRHVLIYEYFIAIFAKENTQVGYVIEKLS